MVRTEVDVLLRAAQQVSLELVCEGLDLARGSHVAIRFEEVVARGEVFGIKQIEDGPQLGDVVLHGSASEGERRHVP